MRWMIYRSLPAHASVRRRRVFAWLPTTVGCFKVWLEFYEVVETCSFAHHGGWAEISRNVLDPYC